MPKKIKNDARTESQAIEKYRDVEKSYTIKQLDGKIDSVSIRLDETSKRLEDKVDSVSIRLDEAVKVFGTKYDELKEAFAFFRNDMFSQFDKLFKKLDFHKDEYHAVTYGLRRIEDEHKIIDHRTILERLNKLESRN